MPSHEPYYYFRMGDEMKLVSRTTSKNVCFHDSTGIGWRWSRLQLKLSVLIVLCCYSSHASESTTISTDEAPTTCVASNQEGEGGIRDGACLSHHDSYHVDEPVTVSESNTSTTSTPTDTDAWYLPPTDCQVYVAKSTIPNAGLGVFNGYLPKRTGDDVSSQHGGDVCIPVIDAILHAYDDNNPFSTESQTPFLNFYWDGHILGANSHSILSKGSGVEMFCPGFDTLINCHFGLGGLLSTSVPYYDDLSIPLPYNKIEHHQERYHRSTHPGSGAFTPYFNGTSKVKAQNVTIPPYTELFKDYGEHWFDEQREQHIPLSDDYESIFAVLQKFAQLRIARNTISSGATEVAIELYERLLHRFKDIYESRTLSLLPSALQDAMYIGNGEREQSLTDYLLKKHSTNLEYLQQYGTCIDQIRPGRSTLSNAGHGGFATRPFRKGTIITAAPLLIIPDEKVLFMYNFTKFNHTWYRDYKNRKAYQLLFNYCYGHPYSTVLLCPHGGGVNYINHNRSLVNVKMEWTTTQLSFIHNESLVTNGTLEDLTNLAKGQHGSQLVFQYVATRDIQPNEELFLNYGNDWEWNWLYHVQHYPNSNQITQPTSKYISAHEYNYHFQDALIRTMDEQMVEPYPSNLQIRCHRSIYFSKSVPNAIYEWSRQNYGLPCRILDRWIERDILTTSLHMELYTVQIEHVSTENVSEHHYSSDWSDDDEADTTKKAIWVTRTDVPRSAIRFFDMPYTTDIHQTDAFRHYIQIDDDIFPPQWKNLE